MDCVIGESCKGTKELFKKLIQFLECSWNHEYFGSLAKKVKPEALHFNLAKDLKYS